MARLCRRKRLYECRRARQKTTLGGTECSALHFSPPPHGDVAAVAEETAAAAAATVHFAAVRIANGPVSAIADAKASVFL